MHLGRDNSDNIFFIYINSVNIENNITSLFIKIYCVKKAVLFSDYFLISDIFLDRKEISRRELLNKMDIVKDNLNEHLNRGIEYFYCDLIGKNTEILNVLKKNFIHSKIEIEAKPSPKKPITSIYKTENKVTPSNKKMTETKILVLKEQTFDDPDKLNIQYNHLDTNSIVQDEYIIEENEASPSNKKMTETRILPAKEPAFDHPYKPNKQYNPLDINSLEQDEYIIENEESISD